MRSNFISRPATTWRMEFWARAMQFALLCSGSVGRTKGEEVAELSWPDYD